MAEHLVENKLLLAKVNDIIGEPEPSSSSSRYGGASKPASFMANLNESSSLNVSNVHESSAFASQSLAPLTTGGRVGHIPLFPQEFAKITSADLDEMDELPEDLIDQLYN